MTFAVKTISSFFAVMSGVTMVSVSPISHLMIMQCELRQCLYLL